MARHAALKLAICGLGLSVSSPVLGQDNYWGEGPGDIVITRHVPRQNAVQVGEPGQPTLVNPKTSIMGGNGFSVSSGLFTRPLSDLEAEGVRATRAPEAERLGETAEAMMSEEARGAAFGSAALGHERSGLVSSTVSGAMNGASRQIQGVLSSALGRGRL